MANIRVSVINASTVLTDDEVKTALPALQTQVHQHFAPTWGIDADLNFVPKNAKPSLAGCGNTPLQKQRPSLCAATAAQFSALRNFNVNPAYFSTV
ncbi:hypothetical protein OKW43_008086 [Paraburkholderia sp. WC7.3g]|uniref:hypothetical protein n=1 Tax=Paraburkholderia sp. WC7.3g TaxID=2991070 RepID=UPI003D231035